MLIKVLGPGCAKCKEAESVVMAAVEAAKSSAVVEKITDFKAIMQLGIMSTPAVLIDDKVMCTGHVPSKAEVMGWLAAQNSSTATASNTM